MPTLIIVNGMPATGKSTLSEWLSKELKIPLLSKDSLKEYLFDEMGTYDRDYSMMIGRACAKFLYIVVDEFMAAGRSMIVENAFFKEFAEPEFTDIKNNYQCDIIEIYLYTDEQERLKRFKHREDSGNRHKGHVDGLNYKDMLKNKNINNRYGIIGVGEIIEVDTTNYKEINHQELLGKVKRIIKGGY